MLGDRKLFTKDFVEPLDDGHTADATDEQLAARRTAQNELNDRISHMHLRRTKELIKDQLPKKIDRIVFCPLTRVQRDCYKNILDSETIRFIKKRNDPCDCRPPWLACCGAARPAAGEDPDSTGCTCDDRDVAPAPAPKSCTACKSAAPKNCRKHCCYRFSRNHLKAKVCICNKVGTVDPKTNKLIRACKFKSVPGFFETRSLVESARGYVGTFGKSKYNQQITQHSAIIVKTLVHDDAHWSTFQSLLTSANPMVP